MNARSSRLTPALVAGLLLVLPLVYVGSYVLLVDTAGRLVMGDDGTCYVREYRYGGSAATVLYWPVRQVHRQWQSLEDE